MAKHLTWCLGRTLLLTKRLNVHRQFAPKLRVDYCTVQSRFVTAPRATQINVDYDEPKDFEEFKEDSKKNCGHVLEALMKTLSVASESAKKAIEDYPKFKEISPKMILKNFQILREAGLYKSTIKDNKYLLTDDTETLKKKISIIQNISLDINEMAALFLLPALELSMFVNRLKMDASYLPGCNRIVYLAEKLECGISRVCILLAYNPELLKLPAPKLLSITEYLLSVGMAPQHICNDVNVYKYRAHTIEKRIERAKRLGIDPIKPWVIRCQEQLWKKIEQERAARESVIAPDQTLQDLVRDIFDCDMEAVDYLFKKNPKILGMNVIHLAKVTTFLRNEGYMIEDLQRAPQVLYRKFETMQERYNALKQLTNVRPPLNNFLSTKKRFDSLLERMRIAYENQS